MTKNITTKTKTAKNVVFYKKPVYDQPRTTVVFDLDHTLIHSRHLLTEMPGEPKKEDLNKRNWFAGSTSEMVLPPTGRGFVVTYDDEKTSRRNRKNALQRPTKEALFIFYRPFVVPLLNWCFLHCNVAFWSTGTERYVRDIVRRLLHDCNKLPSDLLFAWARANPQKNYRNNKWKWGNHPSSADAIKFVDVFTQCAVEPPKKNNCDMRNQDTHKDMRYIFTRFPRLSREHIVLVDNLPDHMPGNDPHNILWMPPFVYANAHDRVLKVMLQELQRRTPAIKSSSSGPDLYPPSSEKHCPLFNANDLRNVLTRVSSTNDNVLHSSGYVPDPTSLFQYYEDPKTLRRGTRVSIPYADDTVIGIVVRRNLHQGYVDVRVKRRKSANAAAQRLGIQTVRASPVRTIAKSTKASTRLQYTVLRVPIGMILRVY